MLIVFLSFCFKSQLGSDFINTNNKSIIDVFIDRILYSVLIQIFFNVLLLIWLRLFIDCLHYNEKNRRSMKTKRRFILWWSKRPFNIIYLLSDRNLWFHSKGKIIMDNINMAFRLYWDPLCVFFIQKNIIINFLLVDVTYRLVLFVVDFLI